LGLNIKQECRQHPSDYTELNNMAVILKNKFEVAKSDLDQLSSSVINEQKDL
jgi:hypothetical protein